METISSSASLPIKQIRDVNLAWVRTDLGDIEVLRDSIREEGLQLPILLTTNMFVADGARRLVACEQLGWERVPVVATSDWDLVTKYYKRTRELAREGWPSEPMSWSDLYDLLNGPMKDLYAERYRVLRKKVVDHNARMRMTGGKPVVEKKHLYTTAVSQALGFKDSDLRSIREVYTALRKLGRPAEKGEDPGKVDQRHLWAKTLGEQFVESEQNGGDRLYAIMARVRLAAQGKDWGAVKAIRGRRNLGDPSVEQRRAANAEAAPTGREADATFIKNTEKLLRDLGDTAAFYTHVRPNVRMSDAAEAADNMKKSIGKLNGLIRVIRAYGNANLEERSEA